MEHLLRLIEGLRGLIKKLIVEKNIQTEASKKLYETALTFLGVDASPEDRAPDELSCAETLNAICQKAWGEPAGGGLSTYWLYFNLKNHRKFVQVTTPLAGDIVVAPTGLQRRKTAITNGHTGIVGLNNKIMSSDSKTGLFVENYTLDTFNYRYQTLGAYPVFYFRRVEI
jgi:hypothetical protein